MAQRSLAKPVPTEVLEALVEESAKVPLRVWCAILDARWRSEGDFSTELGKISAPTLIVWGDRDARYPRSEQDALAQAIAGSRLVVFPGAGHHLHIEEPERFGGVLASFAAHINRRCGVDGEADGGEA
jgi:pimeloyl-ACP methyl ester carboxylesterase